MGPEGGEEVVPEPLALWQWDEEIDRRADHPAAFVTQYPFGAVGPGDDTTVAVTDHQTVGVPTKASFHRFESLRVQCW